VRTAASDTLILAVLESEKNGLAVVVDGSVASFFTVLRREFPTRDGTMLMVRAGARSLWCSLWILVAAAVAPLGRWNMAVEIVFVGIDGAKGRNAWEVAPVLLIAEGTDPLRTAVQSVGGDARMNCVLLLSA
jgi:hypothetical protein